MTNSKRVTPKNQAGTKDTDAERLDTDAEITKLNIPADEETEGATNALEAPLLPQENTKDKKPAGG